MPFPSFIYTKQQEKANQTKKEANASSKKSGTL
jgi:hypothetical protein